ncbi:MAG TPA: hypothetical protein VGT61_01555 [Thermomicrobiales bacterium]|jgi:hypothetical protein|nr:hypothetical protein [Thermomicrobiales bacterium]
MTGTINAVPADGQPRDDDRFEWHPQYQGQTVGEVRTALIDELRGDQRSYALTIDGPDENEQAIFVRVVGLERRWGPYAMDWASADTATLAERALAHEWARERRRELFPYSELRDRDRSAAPAAPATSEGGGGDAGEDRPWWAFWRR